MSAGLEAAAQSALPAECRALSADAWTAASWESPELAERCAALPGLAQDERSQALITSAQTRAAIGDYAGAEKALKASLELKPSFTAAFRLAALLRDRPEQARTYAESAARLAPEARRRAAAYARLADIQIDLDDDEGAKASAARALESSPADLDALRLLAGLNAKNPKIASAYADRAWQAAHGAPSWQRASADRLCASIFALLGDDAGAAGSLQEVLDIDPYDVHALKMLIQMRHRGARFQFPLAAARPASEPALARDPGELEELRAQAERELAAGRKNEARQYAARFTASVADAPAWQHNAAYHLGARLWLQLGDIKAAARSVNQLYSLLSRPDDGLAEIARARNEPDNGSSWWGAIRSVSVLRLELGDAAGAEAALAHGLELDPDNVHLLEEIARIELSRGKSDEALAYARRMLAASARQTPADVLRRRANDTLLPSKDSLTFHEEWAAAALKDPETAQSARDEIAHDRWNAHRTTAEVLAALGRLDEALRINTESEGLARSLGEEPLLKTREQRTEIDERMVKLLLARGRAKEAQKYADEISQLAPRRAAQAYREIAQNRISLQDERGAEESLSRALAAAPDDAQTLNVAVDYQLSRRRPDRALVFAERIEKSKSAASAGEREQIYRKLAQIHLLLGNQQAAQENIERGLAAAPDAPALLREAARLRLARGQPEAALAYIDRLLKSSETVSQEQSADDYFTRAQAQRLLHDENGARESLEKALAAMPEHARALDALIEADLAEHRPQNALARALSLQKAAASASPGERAEAFGKTAEIQEALGDRVGALKSLESALQADPEDANWLRRLLDADESEPGNVISLAQKHTPAPSRRAPWLVLRGIARSLTKDEAGARADYDAAMEVGPSSACFHESVLAERGRLDAYYFDRCLERFPKDGGLYSDRGVARYLAGHAAEAESDFRRAIALAPDRAEAYLSLASLLSTQSRSGEAAAIADRGISGARKGEALDRLVALRRSLRGEP